MRSKIALCLEDGTKRAVKDCGVEAGNVQERTSRVEKRIRRRDRLLDAGCAEEAPLKVYER